MQRRTILTFGGVLLGAGGIAWWQRNPITSRLLTRHENAAVALTDAAAVDGEPCMLTPEQIEGPFFLRAPIRRDIREDRIGVNLQLELQVVAADSCQPIEGAVVEIWHCDAAGRYSGYPEDMSRHPFDTLMFLGPTGEHVAAENDKTYLRGAQRTDGRGTVRFDTIFPGWYEPRTTHIHAKVFVGETAYTTTQLYFPDALSQRIYRDHTAYAAYGQSPYTKDNDLVLGQHPDANGLLLRPRNALTGTDAGTSAGIDADLTATARLGIRTA